MGRSPGNGRIEAQRRGGQKVYVGYWMGADGRRHMRALASEKRVAEEMLAKLIRDRNLAMAGMSSESGFETRLSVIVDRYLKDLQSTRKARHVENVERQLRRIIEDLGTGAQVRTVGMERMLDYRRKRSAGGASNRTCNAELGALKACFAWAVRSSLIGKNPLENLKPLSQQEADLRKRRRALTDAEIGAFLDASRTLDDERQKFYSAEKTIAGGTRGTEWNQKKRRLTIPQTPLWWLLMERGLRWGEATLLRWDDLDEERARLTVRPSTAKTKRSRVIPIPRALVDALADLRRIQAAAKGKHPAGADPIFLSRLGTSWKPSTARNARGDLDEILQRAGIEKIDASGRSVDIHALRGTAATRLLRAAVPMPSIIELFGWRDANMLLKHYAHLRIEDTEKAVSSIPDISELAKSGNETCDNRRMDQTRPAGNE